jgi:hypothetical protein
LDFVSWQRLGFAQAEGSPFALIAASGWMNRRQLRVIDYAREEDRVLREGANRLN